MVDRRNVGALNAQTVPVLSRAGGQPASAPQPEWKLCLAPALSPRPRQISTAWNVRNSRPRFTSSSLVRSTPNFVAT
jgi:hypothetical protein